MNRCLLLSAGNKYLHVVLGEGAMIRRFDLASHTAGAPVRPREGGRFHAVRAHPEDPASLVVAGSKLDTYPGAEIAVLLQCRHAAARYRLPRLPVRLRGRRQPRIELPPGTGPSLPEVPGWPALLADEELRERYHHLYPADRLPPAAGADPREDFIVSYRDGTPEREVRRIEEERSQNYRRWNRLGALFECRVLRDGLAELE